MVPLKDMLTGVAPPPLGSNGRLTSMQKCVRAGGKHNDLDNVGMTARHHTFFEMLGNFSIGNYFKEEAILLAWNFITKELCLPSSRLRVSVFESDDEAARLWSRISGLSESSGRLIRLGAKDNFWSMGDSAGTPCGPCSEIFYDQQKDIDGERWLEIWNLVFMQYARGRNVDELVPLQTPCVDTGMGLERLASVMQGVPTNYDTDLMRPLIDALRELVARRGSHSKRGVTASSTSTLLPWSSGLDRSIESTSLKVIVDHLRSSSFLLAEGVTPSNVGRGYVLRRIIRRAVRFGTNLGLSEPFLSQLLPTLIHTMGDTSTELRQRQETIASGLEIEEANFFSTLSRGMRVLEDAFTKRRTKGSVSINAQGRPVLSGEVAFLLYDSYGFPLDLTQLIARERNPDGTAASSVAESDGDDASITNRGWDVDVARFDELMKQQKEQSKATTFHTASNATHSSSATPAAIPNEVKQLQAAGLTNEFIGYDTLIARDVRVLNHHLSTSPTTSPSSPHHLWLTLERTPFYANGGGQIGDVGRIKLNDGMTLQVVDCVRPYEGLSVMRLTIPTQPSLNLNSILEQLSPDFIIPLVEVDAQHRHGVAAHHTATHLLHAALKAVLGGGNSSDTNTENATSVDVSKPITSKSKSSAPTLTAASINQAGSLVSSDRLRFDFSCPCTLNPTRINQIETWVNNAILDASMRSNHAAIGEQDVSVSDRTNSPITGGSVLTQVMSKEEATKMNALALFGEKYGSSVRVVSIPGYSIELCGGTHVHDLRQCYPFMITHTSSVASGVRRIEAVTGINAVKRLQASHSTLVSLAAELKTTPETVMKAVSKMNTRIRELESEVKSMRTKLMLSGGGKSASSSSTATTAPAAVTATFTVDASTSVPIKIHQVPEDMASPGSLRETCLSLSSTDSSSFHLLLCPTTGQATVCGGYGVTPTNGSNESVSIPARRIWMRLQTSLSKQGAMDKGKGGGSDKIAAGVLPIKYADSSVSFIERVQTALADEQC